jgi:hypothetical protein
LRDEAVRHGNEVVRIKRFFDQNEVADPSGRLLEILATFGGDQNRGGRKFDGIPLGKGVAVDHQEIGLQPLALFEKASKLVREPHPKPVLGGEEEIVHVAGQRRPIDNQDIS